MINQEVRKQRFDHFKKGVLAVLTTALRSPLLLLMGCGYVHWIGKRRNVHDHDGVKIVDTGIFIKEEYDKNRHGEITGWLEVGEPLVYKGQVMESRDGRTATHRHVFSGDPKWSGTIYSHEFSYE